LIALSGRQFKTVSHQQSRDVQRVDVVVGTVFVVLVVDEVVFVTVTDVDDV
jgi:hypothetical protein